MKKIEIKFNRDAVLKNMLDWDQYIAITKFSDLGNTELVLNNNMKAMIAYKILHKAIIYTPVDTGKLRNSVYIKMHGTGYEIGYTCEYAIYVHEIGVNHHKPPTQYKYLEDAAFEVITEYKAETGIELPVTIEYDPLRIFIGVDDAPGESLTGIKANEKLYQTPETYNKVWNDFMSYNPDTASEAEVAYYNKMIDFFTYYEDFRHMTDMAILREWLDRQRHK